MQSISTEFLAAAMAAKPEHLKEALAILKGASVSKVALAPAPDRFMTLTELSKTIGIGRMSLWRWRVPGHQHAGRVHYRASEVLAYLKTHDFQHTVKALKANGWKRPSAAEVARIALDEAEPTPEEASTEGGVAHV